MKKLEKKYIKKDAEKKYEYRFYRYLGLVIIILFSCIVTVSNLINPGETRKLIAEIVRNDYSEFFQYELHNSDKSLEDIYVSYSKDKDIEVYKLMALNTIYFGQDKNRYLEPYIRPYIDKNNLSKSDRIKLYGDVNREIKNIENKYTFKLIVKRFSPYILAIAFVTLIMGSASFIRKRNNVERNIINIFIFLAGIYICYLSIINVKHGIWINLAIMLALTEFIIENKTILLEYIGGSIILIILALSILGKFECKTNELDKYDVNKLVLVNNFQGANFVEGEQAIQRIGRALYFEMKKENMILIDNSSEEINSIIENKEKIIFNSKETNKPAFYMCLYNNIPIYRLALVKDGYIIKIYEGVLSPYMRSTLMKLERVKGYKKNKMCNIKNVKIIN
ncbi:hypothetical protein ACSXAG_14800 [Clostridium perfringens]